mgnify:CR=1 FL=1
MALSFVRYQRVFDIKILYPKFAIFTKRGLTQTWLRLYRQMLCFVAIYLSQIQYLFSW